MSRYVELAQTPRSRQRNSRNLARRPDFQVKRRDKA